MYIMKHFTFFFALTLLLAVTIWPVAAHDGPVDNVTAETVPSSQIPLMFLAIGVGIIAATGRQSLGKPKLSLLQLGVLALGVMTAILHLIVGIEGEWLLLLNGLGYLGLMALLYLPLNFIQKQMKQPLHWVVLGYTVITLVGYFVTHPLGAYDSFGLLTKLVEVLLIVAVWLRLQQAPQEEAITKRRRKASGRSTASAD